MKHMQFSDDLRQFIIEKYLNTYSVTIVKEHVNKMYDNSIGRGPITNVLKDAGIYEGLNGPNYLKKKVENNEKIMMEKYGVINIGQLGTSGWTAQNKVQYSKMRMTSDINKYRKDVNKLTNQYTRKLLKENKIPSHCEYTGVEFADTGKKEVNPNDPAKRTVDHIVPVTYAYILGWTPEETSDPSNISYILRIVNGFKSNTDYDSFAKYIPHIKRILTNEGYICS